MISYPLWLYTGPEIGERTQAIEQLRQITEKKFGQLDVHYLYVHDIKVEEVISLIENGSLFAEERFVVLRNAELIKKKEEITCIIDWASKSAGKTNSVLMLVSDEIGIDKKIENIIPKEQKKIFWELFENRKEQWLRDYFRKSGFKISQDAIEVILELVENNTEALRSECSRLTMFFDASHEIIVEDVEYVLAHSREESAFTLFDKLINGSLENVLEILNKIQLSKESSGIQLIAGLTFCFRRLMLWHQLFLNTKPSDFDLKTRGFTSVKAKEQYSKAQRKWSAFETTRILALLSQTDMDIRRGGGTVEKYYLELLFYSIVQKKGLSLAIAEYNSLF